MNDKVRSLIRVLSDDCRSSGKNCDDKSFEEEFLKKKIAYEDVSSLWKSALKNPPFLRFALYIFRKNSFYGRYTMD